MTSIIDAWRAVDPEAKLISGSVQLLSRPARGIARTRAAPPHLPPISPGQLLVADAGVLDDDLDRLMAALDEAELEPAAIWLVGEPVRGLQRAGSALPVIAGGMGPARLADALEAYLEAEKQQLTAAAVEVRLAGAEAALADPRPGAPAGVLAGRLHRGVAVIVDGALAALNPRPAGTALATRFAATHARLLGDRSASATAPRRTRDGLWILERPIGPTASAWLFDDLPFGAMDEVSLQALAVTLRALLRRPPASSSARGGARMPSSTGDALRDTLLAVARANGRIAPAARSLGVHRNTVLYRLRRASTDLGIDPRRSEDALRLLQSAEPPGD